MMEKGPVNGPIPPPAAPGTTTLPAESAQRCEAIFHGHVQGVGFRFTVERAVTPYLITGYVRNERDGTVLLVAEGQRKDVAMSIQSVLGTMSGYVTRHEERWLPATGEFDGFGIRRLP
jgi:acylphosphatase